MSGSGRLDKVLLHSRVQKITSKSVEDNSGKDYRVLAGDEATSGDDER